MAKSARSTDRKRNNAKLRAKVFEPVYAARTARLSEKLQQLAAQPKPGQDKVMDVDVEASDEATSSKDAEASKSEDADVTMAGVSKPRSKTHKKPASGRIVKSSRKKARNQMVFPKNMAKEKRLARSKNKSG